MKGRSQKSNQLGNLKFVLGGKIHEADTAWICILYAHAEKILKKIGMENCTSVAALVEVSYC